MISHTSAFLDSHNDQNLLWKVTIIEKKKVGGDTLYLTFSSSNIVISSIL